MKPTSKRPSSREALPQEHTPQRRGDDTQHRPPPPPPPPATRSRIEGASASPECPDLPHLTSNAAVAAPAAGMATSSAISSSSHISAPAAASSTSLAPIRRGRAGSVDDGVVASPPPSAVTHTYPGATPTTASMELVVVPFNAARGAGSGSAGEGGASGEPGTGGAYYGELAPLTLSTERVCPHCLRPYDMDMSDEDGVGAGGAGGFAPSVFFRMDAAGAAQRSPNHPQLLLPPTARPSADAGVQEAEGAGRRPAAAASSAPGPTAPSMTGFAGPRLVAAAQRGGFVADVHPPSAAFTAHYFRALPPPALPMAVAAGVAPLAIEDYQSPLTPVADTGSGGGSARRAGEDEEHAPPGGVMATMPYREPVGTATRAAALPPPPHFSYVSPTTRVGPPVRTLLQHRREDAGGENEEVVTPATNTNTTTTPTPTPTPQSAEEDLAASSCEGGSPVFSPTAAAPISTNGYYRQYFKELRQLGRGTFGGVYLCRHVMCGVNLGEFAVKKVPVGDKTTYLLSVLREVRILEEVRRHPNVVEYKHSWVEEAQLADFGPPVRCLFILMEYASAGSLDAYLDRYGTNLSTLAVWYFFLSSVAGTAHLHEKHILHRDLKPQNLLLAAVDGRPPRVLVSDFGTAALLEDISYDRSGGTGTLEYMAPELFETTASPRGTSECYVNHHTMASDVWSLGMVLYYLAFDSTLPERREDGSVNLDKARRHANARPPEMLRLLEAMLQLDPAKRPRCSDILGSSLVQSMLRVFNRDDHTQWETAVQQQQQRTTPSSGPSNAPTPATAALLPPERPARPPLPTPTRNSVPALPSGGVGSAGAATRGSQRGAGGGGRGRNFITVLSASSSGRVTAAAAPPRAGDEVEVIDPLLSSRVELLSTPALLDLPSVAGRAGSGSTSSRNAVGRFPPHAIPPTGASSSASEHPQRNRTSAHSPTTNRASFLHNLRFSDSPPPPRRADAEVQTEPVIITEKGREKPRS